MFIIFAGKLIHIPKKRLIQSVVEISRPASTEYGNVLHHCFKFHPSQLFGFLCFDRCISFYFSRSVQIMFSHKLSMKFILLLTILFCRLGNYRNLNSKANGIFHSSLREVLSCHMKIIHYLCNFFAMSAHVLRPLFVYCIHFFNVFLLWCHIHCRVS